MSEIGGPPQSMKFRFPQSAKSESVESDTEFLQELRAGIVIESFSRWLQYTGGDKPLAAMLMLGELMVRQTKL